MDFSIKLEELHRMEMLFRKSASNIGNNKNSFSGISNSVDNNIKNRRDINYKLHTLYKDLDDIELQLYRIGDFLADTRKSYLGAEERLQMYKNSAEINRYKKAQQPDKKEENFFTRIGNSFSSGIEHIKNFFSNSSDEKNNDSVLDYLERSAKQVIMGNYTDEVTAWGTGMQLCLGLTGADIVMDIRDIVYDFHKWEWSFEHVGQTGFDVLSVVPLIGALKYSDEVVDLVKGVNKTSDVVKNVDRATDIIRGASNLNPNKIRFSQSSVNGSQEIIENMAKNGWVGDPIDVVKMSDGGLTTIDNTRVVAARAAGIDVQAVVHNADYLLPEHLIERFTTKKGVPKTWGEAIELRIGKQNSGFRANNQYGSLEMEKIK